MMGLLGKKTLWPALAWLLFLAATAMLAPVFLSTNAEKMEFARLLEAPSASHPLGTDALGRDVLSRLLCGTSVSLGAAATAVGVALLIGVLIGAVAGYFGGAWDRLLMAFVDVMLCFPTFFLILAVIAVLGPGLWNIILIIGVTSWMSTARLVRAEILALKEREFVLAARALGAGSGRIIFRHLVPNSLGPVIVNGILSVSTAILVESGLSFLGIGVQPPTPSWGNLLFDSKAALGVAWWQVLFPGLTIFFTVLSVNVVGEEAHRLVRGEE